MPCVGDLITTDNEHLQVSRFLKLDIRAAAVNRDTWCDKLQQVCTSNACLFSFILIVDPGDKKRSLSLKDPRGLQ